MAVLAPLELESRGEAAEQGDGLMHVCQDELLTLIAAREHVHCLICWGKVWWQWLRCRVGGH
jgi:hypothetical protein